MKATLHKKLGKNTMLELVVEGELKDIMFAVAPVANAPEVCQKCESDKIEVNCRVVKTEDGPLSYIEYRCQACHAVQQWGEYKAPKGCFYLKPWEDPYSKRNGEEKPSKK